MFFEKPEDRKYAGKEHSIVIMNHKYETEFLMCWTLAERYGLLGVSRAMSPTPQKPHLPADPRWTWLLQPLLTRFYLILFAQEAGRSNLVVVNYLV